MQYHLSPRRTPGRTNFIALAIVLAGLIAGGCTTTLTESHTGGEAPESAIQLEAKSARVVLMPLDIQLTELTAGGLEEPKADWTESARHHVTAGLTAALADRGLTLREYRRPKKSASRRRDDQLEKLHSKVGGTIIVHHYDPMFHLPTKQGRLDWGLGETARQMGNDQESEFALFVFLRDSYATGGRKAAMVASTIVSSLIGTPVAKAGERVGFASLVDLRNGEVVWFNILYSDSGDLREDAPARAVVDDLMAGFPI